jgi:hypothetical protein
MTPEAIAALFTRADGSYFFSRWGRPIVPVVFGGDDKTLSIFKGAIEAIVTLAGHKMAETDVELGANLMVFLLRDWEELLAVPGLNAIVPELDRLCPRLKAQGANQYRLFRFDPQGAIRAAFVFLCMDDALSVMPAEDLALAQAAQVICLWSDQAFRGQSPLAKVDQLVILRPEIAGVIRASYDRVMPEHSADPSHALRVYARLNLVPG